MKRELDEKLCKIAPHLFADRLGNMQQTAMCWGFECGDGWYKILEEAARKIEPLIVAAIAADPKAGEYGFFRASQIKEKYGTLRFYLSGGTDEMYKITHKAMKQSGKICEVCGKAGMLRGRGWLFTRCTKCWKTEQS